MRSSFMIRRVLAAGILLFISCIPTTRPAALMHEFLDVYNSGDFARVAAFFERHDTSTDHAKRRERADDRARWVRGFVYPGVRRFVPERVTATSADAITILG